MRRIVVLAAVLGVVSGVLGAFAFSVLSDEASAALFAFVRETNVDANGDIRVHEQGTANVNVTNDTVPVTGTVDVGNLPAVQDVNVLSLPSSQGRLIELGTQPVEVRREVEFPLVNVSDCSGITAVATAPEGRVWLSVPAVSLDGITKFPAQFFEHASADNVAAFQGVWPFASVSVANLTGTTANITAWIWCAP